MRLPPAVGSRRVPPRTLCAGCRHVGEPVPVVFTRRAATTGEDRRSASRTAFGVAAFAGENLPLQLSGTPAAAERQALVSTCSRAGSLALSAPPARLVQQCSFSFFFCPSPYPDVPEAGCGNAPRVV